MRSVRRHRNRLDGNTISLEGDANTQDGFSLTIEAVPSLLGAKADLGTISALLSRDPWGTRDAIAGGEIVITPGEWEPAGQDGPLWCWWGVITEVRSDGTTRGTTFGGVRDWPLAYVERPYTLSVGEAPASPRDWHGELLQRVIRRIRADHHPLLPLSHQPGPVVLFGVSAIAYWTGQLNGGWYQADCPSDRDTSIANASWVARSLAKGASAAASHLNRCFAQFPADKED
jgi:hypothetical protein